ncbi:MAG: HAD family hydrolase [Paludibacteraceae bacterium]|nr:HAD family hydrolase [Paludibacteraceae bacterium]
MKSLVIFDLDGTLLNTIDDLASAANFTLSNYGYPLFSVEEYKYKVGNGIRKLVERALPEQHRTTQEIDDAMAIFMPYYELHKADKTQPYSGISELLQNIQTQGIGIAVATNKAQTAVEGLMLHYFPAIHFTAIMGQTDKRPIKPNPASVNEIMSIAAVSPAETLYIGDSDVDMQTAINANVDACAVTWGFRKRQELEFYNPKHIVDDPSQILEIVSHK